MILQGFVYSRGEMRDASAFYASGLLLAAVIRELSEKVEGEGEARVRPHHSGLEHRVGR